MKNIRVLVVMAILAIAAAGCSGLPLKSIDPNSIMDVQRDEVLIAGKVTVVEVDTEITDYGVERPILTLVNLDTGKSGWNSVEDDGSFWWLVSPGTYAVKKLKYTGDSMRPRVAWRAPRGGRVYYVGTLRVTVVQKSRFGGFIDRIFKGAFKKWVLEDVEILDERAATHERMATGGNAALALEMKNAVMVHVPDMPDNPKKWTVPDDLFR